MLPFFPIEQANKMLPEQVCHQAYLPGWQLEEKNNMDPCIGNENIE